MLLHHFSFVLLLTVYEGVVLGCTNTEVVCTKEKDTVIFFADVTHFLRFHMVRFYNTTNETKTIFKAVIHHSMDFLDIFGLDTSLKNRITVFGKDQMGITIILKNIEKSDNGTYALDIEDTATHCWKLFVLDIKRQHEDGFIQEDSTAKFRGYPQVSLFKKQTLNKTLTWLLHGRNRNQTTLFHEEEDMMIIPSVSRDMDGWNITYRCDDDSGAVLELNETLKVIYIKVHQKNDLIEEGTALLVEGYPSRETTGVTSEWLFGGYNLTETSSKYQFLEHENKLWILFVTRNMDGKNVTYRTTDSNDVINEINSTVSVSYGPDWPVKLIPTKKMYYGRIGDTLPKITCYVDCNPPCNFSWDIKDGGNILKLEQLTMGSQGEYTCTATRMGTNNFMNETIYIYVQDGAYSSTVSFAVLASFQALSVICIGCLVVYILHQRKPRFWKYCCKSSTGKKENSEVGGDESRYDNCPMSTPRNEAYEDLRPETRNSQVEYSSVGIGEVYVNTG